MSAPLHPVATVPDRLFADDAREQRWRARFTATRMSRPDWARDAPDRNVYTSNATGTIEVYAWDRATDTHRQVTDRRAGTHIATLPPDGETVWWFADTDGDEFGHWVAEPFAGRERGSAGSTNRARGAEPVPALPGVEDGYPAGLDIGRRLVTAGTSTDDGTRIWLWDRTSDTPAHVVYAHPEDAGVGALSDDETLLAISHSEHGDSRHPAVRVVRTADGSAVAEKSDGPGKGLAPLSFAPVADPTPGKVRLHLDLNPTDRDQTAELDRLLDLGATPADAEVLGPVRDDTITWHVLADPEGNEFCLLRSRVDPR